MAILNWIWDYLKDIGSSFTKTCKNLVLTSFFWVITIALAIMISMGVMIGTTLHNRPEQNMAKYWQNKGDTSFRQMSVFAKGVGIGTAPKVAEDEENYLTVDSLKTVRENIESKISENNQKSAKLKNKKDKKKPVAKNSNWTDCYSTTFDTSGTYTFTKVVNGKETNEAIPFKANIVAVGGNFKAFHPYEYLSGGFLPVDEVGLNLCVINDNLSWKLFKSYDVTGQTIELFGEDYQIIGVVRENNSSIDALTGSSDYRIFCYFTKMAELNDKGMFATGGSDGGAGGSETPDAGGTFPGDGLGVDGLAGGSTQDYVSSVNPLAITCYEAMLPEVVKGVAKNDVLTSLKSYNASEPQYIIVSNTGRFSISNIYDENMPIGESEKKYADFDFPYWEKAARLSTERLFIEGGIFIFGAFLFIVGVAIAVLRFSKKLKGGVRAPDVDIFTEEAT